MSASALAMPGNSLGVAGSAVMTALHSRKGTPSSSSYLGNGIEAYASSRMEKLLGGGAPGGIHSASSSVSGASDMDGPAESSSGGELREEDVWATEARDWQQEGPVAKGLSLSKDERTGMRLVSRQPRWLGARERDLGLASWNDENTVSKHRTTLLSPFRSYANASPQRIFGQQSTGMRMIPTKADHSQPMVQQSAPVNVPAWGRLAERDENGKVKGDSDSDDEELGRIVPPHELIARQNAESGVVFSVYEGAGRTLKGRDAKKVRNAVLKQTGFFD
eukprot:TRINITY_DN15521_c0_g1_i1.p1 TRINITY_DN15521_c0_g1~~TRINITY_DN15521_c0_g1_i1.p1  ORF type:complete len:277 (+),score=38.31 TRINITY_DN15521_c0_g1_i1:189-1019(+)